MSLPSNFKTSDITVNMKHTIVAAALLAATSFAAKGATLIFTNVGTGALATGFADAESNIASGLVWGVVVDTAGNGFATTAWDAGFTYSANVGGIVLQNSAGGATDDVLFLHTALTSSRTGDGATASSAVNSISTVTFTNGVQGGNAFGIIWFDRGIALNSASADGQKFGFITTGLNPAPTFVLPAGAADATDYSAAFAGTDPTRAANLTLGVIPEPSTALLGLLGVLGLVRRRR
jgi:hypothetical protein